ncbi:hypothetical protein [Halostella sp. PRR32]|uniref:hypothetical protein n=1 Tax=Halostella sp. PRR32 TaxID=3098147 RepID=UPI002B1D8108|nr:hypothetical protein [Halostella sp. PRR32]
MVTLTISTVVTGLFLVAVAGATVVGSRRAASGGSPTRSRDAETAGRSGDPVLPGERLLARLYDDVAAWIVGFVIVTVGFAAAGVFALGDPATLGDMLPILFVAMLALYLLAGVYLLGRQRGHSSALAVAESATAFGVLLVAGVVVKLVAAG